MIDPRQLKYFAPFNQLSLDELTKKASTLNVERHDKGALIFKRGRALNTHYYLVSGEVDLVDHSFSTTTISPDSFRARTALNLDSPTTVAARAKTDAVVLAVPLDLSEVENTLGEINSSIYVTGTHAAVTVEDVHTEENDWMSNLLNMPIFRKLNSKQVQALFKHFETVEVGAGDMIIREGCVGRNFYVLAAGRARVTNKEGTIDKVLNVGEYFGEESLITKAPTNAQIHMESDGVLKRLWPETFMEFLQKPIVNYIDQEALAKANKPIRVIDVRMPVEYRLRHLPGSTNIPLPKLRTSAVTLTPEPLYVIPDDAGTRADIAVHLLCQAGLEAAILRQQAS